MASGAFCSSSKVIIVGAGFSGLAMACQLKRELKCDDFVIYDRDDGFGGTWLANKYPGCGVDIPAAFYSLSFAPNPNFSNFFPKRDEVLHYINNVVSKYDLSRHLVGNTEWIGASWQDDDKTWLVKLRSTSSGKEYTQRCNILVSAVGALTNPNSLNVPGVDRFQGDIIHTARWDQSVSLRDKNVIVLGNGASATQLIPAVAKDARSITQFMRSKQYFLPGGSNVAIDPFWQTIFRYVPCVLLAVRFLIFLYLETSTLQFNLTKTGANMRRETAEISERYVKENAPEKYWPLLLADYQVGCKRRVFDHEGYIFTLNRDNVRLTDDEVIALNERSISTKSGAKYPADVIVLANGFSLTQYDTELCGRGGRSRQEYWKEAGHITAYHSIGMSDFPNFFYILGPNSGRGHTSAVLSIENYTDLIIRIIRPIIAGSAVSVEPDMLSENAYNERLQAALKNTVFNNTCRSWFIDPKTGYNWVIYPWSSFYMWWTTHIAGLEGWVYEYPQTKQTPQSSAFGLNMRTVLPTFAFCLFLGGYTYLIESCGLFVR
ncbi:flavin-containing monooxygenase [Aspergillus vadensis CBS 113365]|uniref:Monooxygenase n=1 Tax=Aspergillus vadensis (strain CBS 113365 / IMI 142717 / IBT 24658) TaxID=1448311 RepID=A0A319BPC7_ASPVC|nr:monooxygenase [Aspergillus vadensis CBS 113365]PYH75266.1 monooxygenase [Aspergillus vadensis CBS 113365]